MVAGCAYFPTFRAADSMHIVKLSSPFRMSQVEKRQRDDWCDDWYLKAIINTIALPFPIRALIVVVSCGLLSI